MTVTMMWDDADKTVMVCKSQGQWTWKEYHETLTEIVESFKEANHRFDLIITREKQTTMPGGSPMPHFQRAMRIMPPNVGLVALVNTNGFARALVSMFSKLSSSKNNVTLIVVGSHEEARAKIAAHRAKNMHKRSA